MHRDVFVCTFFVLQWPSPKGGSEQRSLKVTQAWLLRGLLGRIPLFGPPFGGPLICPTDWTSSPPLINPTSYQGDSERRRKAGPTSWTTTPTWLCTCRSGPRHLQKGGWYGWKPASSSRLSIRVVRAYPLIEIRQAAPCRAIRGNRISVNSTLPPP